MADENIKQVMQDAILDADSLEQFINGSDDETVLTRLSAQYPTLQKAIKTMFENGGLPAKPFETKAQMEIEGATLADGQYTLVTDDTVNNGLYVKTAGAWVKSEYDIPAILAGGILKTNRVFRDEILNSSENLFDPSAATIGNFITTQGLIRPATGRSITNKIYVVGGAKYTLSGGTELIPAFNYVSYFDINDVYIVRDEVGVAGAQTITPPANTSYMRLGIDNGLPSEHERMINVGDTALPYEPYKYPKLKEGLISETTVEYILSQQPDIDINTSHYIKTGVNLFDANTATVGSIIRDTGDIESDSGYSISDYIPVTWGSKYTISGGDVNRDAFTHTAYYDKDRNFIQRVNTWNRTTRELTITIPPNVAFVRFNISGGLPTQFDRMFNKGDAALPYEPYEDTKLTNLILADDVMQQIRVEANQYIDVSSNLFNAETATENKIIRDTGNIESEDGYSASDYIPVEAGAKYTISGGDTGRDAFVHTAYYTKDKVFINRVNTWNRTTRELTITIPENVAFVRFNINGGLPTQHNRMFNKGDAALPYQKHYTHLTGLTLGDDILEQISDEIDISDADKFIFDTPIEGVFNTDQVWTQYLDFPTKKTVEVNQMYEDLRLQHPDYITKQVLGNNSQGKEIRLYKFKPARASTVIKTRAPIIYIVCGTHGGEDVSPLATYLMMEQICNNWRSDKLLEALRFNVEFLIIPIANPYGRDARTRKNANGVDINRSFPEGFGWQSTDPASPYYGGEEPLQELESQYIAQVMDENPNIDACYDFHNFGGTDRDYYLWIATAAGKKMQHMGQVLMQQMGRKWQAEFDWLPQRHDWFAGFVNAQAGATVHDHALAKGIKFAATFETGREWQLTTELTQYDQTHCKTMMEAITNWVLITLRNL